VIQDPYSGPHIYMSLPGCPCKLGHSKYESARSSRVQGSWGGKTYYRSMGEGGGGWAASRHVAQLKSKTSSTRVKAPRDLTQIPGRTLVHRLGVSDTGPKLELLTGTTDIIHEARTKPAVCPEPLPVFHCPKNPLRETIVRRPANVFLKVK